MDANFYCTGSKESIDIFGSQPDRFKTILMSAVAVLAMLISKVLQKARELSVKLFNAEPKQTPKQEPVQHPSEKEMEIKSKIPQKFVMSAEAASYPKLQKIYKELNRQNGIIFDAERERNALEMERDSLKGLAKRYGFHTVHDFYKVYASAKNAYADCQKKADKWKETYGTKSKGDTIHDRIQSYQREESARQSEQIAQRKDRGAR